MSAQIIYGKAPTPFFCGICLEEHPAGTRFGGGHVAVKRDHEHEEITHFFCFRAFKRFINMEEQKNNPTFPCCRANLEQAVDVWAGIGGIVRALRGIFERLLRGNEIIAATLQV
jgi:hypothetical protein